MAIILNLNLLGVEQSVLHDVIFFSILQVENLPENLQKRLKTISTKWQILGFNRIQLMGNGLIPTVLNTLIHVRRYWMIMDQHDFQNTVAAAQ